MPHRFFAPPTKQELCDLRERLNLWADYLTKIYKINTMKKKLVIKFWKTERALALQVLEQEGLPRNKPNGGVRITGGVDAGGKILYLRGEHSSFDFDVVSNTFDDNEERDKYLNEIVQVITDELFTGTGELKAGDMCEVSNDNETWEVHPLITILREGLLRRYIVNVGYNVKAWDCFEYARPLCKRTEPKVETNGEIITYTWEEE